MHNTDERAGIEISIIAAILVLIVVAAVNSHPVLDGLSCKTSYVKTFCSPLATNARNSFH